MKNDFVTALRVHDMVLELVADNASQYVANDGGSGQIASTPRTSVVLLDNARSGYVVCVKTDDSDVLRALPDGIGCTPIHKQPYGV